MYPEYFKNLAYLCAIWSVGLATCNKSIIAPSMMLISFLFFITYFIMMVFSPKEESSINKKENENGFNNIEEYFINDVIDYAYSKNLKARIVVDSDMLVLQNEVEEDKFDKIANMIIPREAKSIKDNLYKRNLNEMQSAIDEYKAKLEEIENA